jgi:uncharacterized protein
MYGFSYAGALQLQTASLQPPHLRTIVPGFGGGPFSNWFYRNGALSLAFIESWVVGDLAPDTASRLGDHRLQDQLRDSMKEISKLYDFLPLSEFPPLQDSRLAPYFFEWIRHQEYDDYWALRDSTIDIARISVPALFLGGWYDVFIEETLSAFEESVRTAEAKADISPHRLIVGPWEHVPWSHVVGDVDFSLDASNSLDSVQLRWFSHWLTDDAPEGWDEEPDVQIFVMGENSWRGESTWPLDRAHDMRYYLHSEGRANTLEGNGLLSLHEPGEEPPDIFVYDPHNPVPSVGGRSCCFADVAPIGARDQRAVELRNDVLVYTTHALTGPVEVTGHVTAQLWAESSHVTTDWTVKLVDVFPDGRAINVVDGIVRASRIGSERPHAEGPACYEIRLGSTSNRFHIGHRIRVEVSSSNFPTYGRNPNSPTTPALATRADFSPAKQTIYHDDLHPSHIVLPVVNP